jgi:hypothetical protein
MALLAETLDELPPSRPLPGIEAAKDFARRTSPSRSGWRTSPGWPATAASTSPAVRCREGTSPAAYVADLRVRAAAALLHDTALPVATVAARCGFNDADVLQPRLQAGGGGVARGLPPLGDVLAPAGRASDMTSSSGALGFGIDVGGSGIKGARVDLDAGAFAADRVRIPTPLPRRPRRCAT